MESPMLCDFRICPLCEIEQKGKKGGRETEAPQPSENASPQIPPLLISLETRALVACTQVILQKVHLQQPCYDFCFLERSNIGQICSQCDTNTENTRVFSHPGLGRERTNIAAACGQRSQ